MQECIAARTGKNNWAGKPRCDTKKRKGDEFDNVVTKLSEKLSATTPTAMAATGERIETGVAELQEELRQQAVKIAQQSTMIGYPNMGTLRQGRGSSKFDILRDRNHE